MTKEQIENTGLAQEAGQADEDMTSGKRERSTIRFPYNDLDDAVGIAKAIHENAGVQCALDQLAAYVKQSLTSGAFRVRVSTAAIFGLTANERGVVRLTELGRHIADPAKEGDARVEAFLQVPLYARIYENYKGFTLPPSAALEKFMREVGVSSKQTNRARQAFTRSAKQAGFFAHGQDRLTLPSAGRGPGTKPIAPEGKAREREGKQNGGTGGNGNGNGGGGILSDIDPIVVGLLARLPQAGSVWLEQDRELWLDLLKGSFKLIYEDTDDSKAKKDELGDSDA